MTDDRVADVLIAALKDAQAESGEQRLYKSGKLPGLFAGRQGVAGEAAARALRDGLLEVVRTETRGKSAIDWVRPTPRTVDFLHACESPLVVLKELQATLAAGQAGVPAWMEAIQKELRTVGDRVAEEARRAFRKLEALGERVEAALQRLDQPQNLPNGTTESVPWANHAVAYLERRKTSGAIAACSLAELFKALAETHAELSVTDFHNGLRRLQDRRALRLLPFTGPPEALSQPEFALLDGAQVLYYVDR